MGKIKQIIRKTIHGVPYTNKFTLLRALKGQSLVINNKIHTALEIAYEAHKDQKRDDGSSYLNQHIYPVTLDIVKMCSKHLAFDLTEDLVCAALLHDVIEDSEKFNFEMLEKKFGIKVRAIVGELTRRPENNIYDDKDEIKRKIVTAEALSFNKKTLYARIIKLADRINNLESSVTIKKTRPEKFARHLEQTKELYLPLAEKTNEYFYQRMKNVIERLSRLT